MGKWLNFEISGSLNLISKQEMKMLIFRLFVPSLGWVNVLHPLISNAHFSGGLPPSSTPPDPGFRTELATDADVNIYILGRGSKAVRFQPITLLIRWPIIFVESVLSTNQNVDLVNKLNLEGKRLIMEDKR